MVILLFQSNIGGRVVPTDFPGTVPRYAGYQGRCGGTYTGTVQVSRPPLSKKFSVFKLPVGLDTADERRLLDRRIAFEIIRKELQKLSDLCGKNLTR